MSENTTYDDGGRSAGGTARTVHMPMNRYQWMSVARAALVNAGISPSAADKALDHAGLEPRSSEDTGRPTDADWEAAWVAGGVRLFTSPGFASRI